MKSQPVTFSTRRRGLTIAEAAISMVIVASMLAAAMQASATSSKIQAVAARQSLASTLASGLLSEIMEASYTQSGSTSIGRESGENGSNKTNYNDVDDYNGWSESPPQDRSGVALPGATGYSRSVAVVWVTVANPTVVSASETGLKRITVTVTGSGVTTQMTGYRANVD